MYNIFVIFKCIEGKREAFVERVKAEGILDMIRGEDGCIRYDYYYSDSDASEILLIEAWETKEKQRIHIEQPHMAALRALKPEYILDTKLVEYDLK